MIQGYMNEVVASPLYSSPRSLKHVLEAGRLLPEIIFSRKIYSQERGELNELYR